MLQSLEKTEKELQESELRFHLLAENATDLISRHSPDGTFLYASPICRPNLGYIPEDLIGRNIFKFIHRDDVGKLKKIFTTRREKQNKPITYRIKRKEGDYRWFESHVRLILMKQEKSYVKYN